MKRGTTTVNYEVENALLKAALGYTKTSVKTYIENKSDKAGNRQVRMEKEETEEKKNSVMPLAIGFISTASIIGIGLYIYKRRND